MSIGYEVDGKPGRQSMARGVQVQEWVGQFIETSNGEELPSRLREYSKWSKYRAALFERRVPGERISGASCAGQDLVWRI